MAPPASSSTTTDSSSFRRRALLFTVICAVAAAAVVVYAWNARRERSPEPTDAAAGVGISSALREVRQGPHVLFRSTALGPEYGRISVLPLSRLDGPRLATPLSADRVYAAADGSGFYLGASRRAFTTYKAVSFDADFQLKHTFTLAGAPSRTRVSPHGRYAVSTVFVTGDSYNSGGFSTRTTLFDLREGKKVADLEEFAVQKDGVVFKEADFNFWGVTFAENEDIFFATLASRDVTYLIKGSVSGREARVVRAGVECPSLSPDGTRLAFKSRSIQNGRRLWWLHVLTLSSNAEVALSETNNVDDQAEWLDNNTVLYALPRDSGATGQTDVWMAPADGTGKPVRLITDASSPCVVRR